MTPSPFIVRKFVRFAHCDPAGIIFYPQYFMLAHECKEDWFREAIGYPFERMVTAERRGFPIVKVDAEFVRASRLGDELGFAITVRSVGATSLKLSYRCFCGDEERMRINSVLVMIDLDAGTPVTIPDWLRQRFAAFQEPLQ
ncbi:MAG: thioesterase family protein [Betaproteobacteria bacterium]